MPCLVALTLLTACSAGEQLPKLGVFASPKFSGGIVADEPRAVLVGRDTLAAGGTAADAAVAMYFTLAVTFPSTASLGGGGLCQVYRPNEDDGDTVEVIEFPARAPSTITADVRRPAAVPGAVRGMYALQARYGRLAWAQLLAPAENFARLGHPVSRALARDLSLAGEALLRDPAARAIFGTADGLAVSEGQSVQQLDLAAILSQLRIKGPGDFYVGAVAHQLVAAVRAAGGSLSLDDLRDYRPAWRPAVELPFGEHVLYTAPPPAAGGVTAAAIWLLLTQGDRYLDAGVDERPHLLAEASVRAFADRANWLNGAGQAPLDANRLEASMASYDAARHTAPAELTPAPEARHENPAATSFVAVDGSGMAVVCLATLNNLFGVGRIAPGTGIFLAAAPKAPGAKSVSLAPMMLVNHNTNQLFFAAGATGGVGAPSALAAVMLGTLLEKRSLREAIDAPRLHDSGMPDKTLVETRLDRAARDALVQRGHNVESVAEIGRVNAINCPGGLPRSPETCQFETDRRGFGLATGGVF